MDVESLDTQEDAAPFLGINIVRKCTIEKGRRCCPIIKVHRPYKVKKVKKVVDVVNGVRQIISRGKKWEVRRYAPNIRDFKTCHGEALLRRQRSSKTSKNWEKHYVLPAKLKWLRSAASCVDTATAGNPDPSMRGENTRNKCYFLSP